jgi:hypothetical protein
LRLTDSGLGDYLADVAQLLDRYGAASHDPDGDLVIEATGDRARTFDLRRFLPTGRNPSGAILDIRETWIAGDFSGFERAEYVYELRDHERDFRIAFHHHDQDVFIRRFAVVVHQHCERPIGAIDCAHYEASPIRDAFAGVMALIDVWTSDPPDCAALRCLA